MKPNSPPFRWLLLCAALLLSSAPQAAVRVSDDMGRQITLPAPARRIVSLAPHVTELLYAAGAGDRLVGAAEFSDYPPAALALPRVGGAGSLDLERILALRPDLVVAWQSGNGAAVIGRLRELGLPVFASEPRRLEDVSANLRRLGVLAGTQARADAAAAAFDRRRRALAARYAKAPRLRVFYELWDQPLMTVGGDHLIDEVIGLCGGDNVFAELAPLAPTVSVEAVLRRNPVAIIAGIETADRDWLQAWRAWPQLTAVAADNLFSVPPDLLHRQSPRILDGAERVCRALEQARRRLDSDRR